MGAGYKIEWSARAVDDFNGIVGFLSEKWGDKEIRKFVRSLDKHINQIQSTPDIYVATAYRSGLRRCVMSRIHTLYYLVGDNTVYIVTVWDNRRNPHELGQVLK